MKYLYHILLPVIMLAVMAACGNDDFSTPESQSDLTIVKSTVNFGPEKSTGEIEYSASRPVTVESDSKSWCTVAQEGNTVTINVTAFNQIESRTAIVTLTDGYKKIRVPVHQDGFVLRVGKSMFMTGHNADEFDLKVTSNDKYTIETSEDVSSWLTYTKTSDGYHFKLAAASKDRTASIYFKSTVGVNDTVQVAQINSEGNYIAYYYSPDESNNMQQYYAPVTVTNDSIKGLDVNFAYTLNEDKTISISAGQPLGKFRVYYLYSVAASVDGYITWNKNVTYTATPVLTKSGTFGYVFGDDGSWTGRKINGIAAYAFRQEPPSGQPNMLGWYAYYQDLVLIKQP